MKEIKTPIKHPLHGYRYRPPAKEKAPPKKLRDDPLVHELMKYFRERLGVIELDGYFGRNYDACAELIARCKQKGSDPKQTIETLIDVALNTPFYGARATSFQFLIDNAIKIYRTHKERFSKPASKLDEALRRHEQRRAGERAGDGVDAAPSDQQEPASGA